MNISKYLNYINFTFKMFLGAAVSSVILVIGNFLADIALALLDPRIRDMSGGDA